MKTSNFHKDIRNDLKDHKEWLESLNIENSSKLDTQEKNRFKESEEMTEKEKKRWEHLYELNKIQNDTKQFITDARRLQEEKETMNCTFQPKILDSSLKMAKNYSKVDFHKRSEFWEKEKEHKIKQIYENKKDKDLLHCTFKPKILEIDGHKLKPDCVNVFEKSGVDKYVERQKLARKEKERKKEILKGNNANTVKVKGGNSYTKGFKKKYGNMESEFSALNKEKFGDSVLSLHYLLNSIDFEI